MIMYDDQNSSNKAALASPLIPKAVIIGGLVLGGLFFTSGAARADDFLESGFSNPWHGFYLGGDLAALGAGGKINKAGGQKDFEQSQGLLAPNLHLGYNFASSLNGQSGWMLGTELGLAYAGVDEKKNDAVLGDAKLDGSFLATTRLRAGYVFNRLFVYGSAGLAFTDMTLRPAGNKDVTITIGPSLGLGAEYKFTDDWSMRVEAQNHFLADDEYAFNGTTRKVERAMGSISVGFSRKF